MSEPTSKVQESPAASTGTDEEPKKNSVTTGQRDYTPAQRAAIAIASLIALFVVWDLTTRNFDIPPIFLPEPGNIALALVESYQSGELMPNAINSVTLFFWSMMISFVIAIPGGIVVGAVAFLNRTFTTWLWAIYTSPRIVFLPLILVWFGITTTAKVIIIVISAVPPIMVIVIEGVKTVEGSMLRVARVYGASRRQTLQKIVIPGTLPFIGTGVRMGVSRGLVGLLGAELFTAHVGLGYLLMDASRRYNTALVFGILAVYMLFCMTTIALSNTLEKRLSRWRD